MVNHIVGTIRCRDLQIFNKLHGNDMCNGFIILSSIIKHVFQLLQRVFLHHIEIAAAWIAISVEGIGNR